MSPEASKQEFEEFLRMSGHSLDALTPDDGVEMMLRFYESRRADECDCDHDGDMMLFQWGKSRSRLGSDAEVFAYDITRQFIVGAGEDGDISQLSLVFEFQLDSNLRRIEGGDRWCDSPATSEEFRRFILEQPSTRAVTGRSQYQVVLVYDQV